MKKYTVKENEDLGSIAQKFGMVSWKYLYEINREAIGDNPDLLKPGTRLEIPRWDSTSGDEKIKAKDADPFKYTGGIRYRYPWVPFSLSLTDEQKVPLKEFETEREVIFRDRTTKQVVSKTTVKKSDDIEMLVPGTNNLEVGIKDFPLSINGQTHLHPDNDPTTRPKELQEPSGDYPKEDA